MNKQQNLIAAGVAALWLGGSLTSVSAADPPSFESPDYQQVGAAILQSEAPPQQAMGTVFVSFVNAEADEFVPEFQTLYPSGTVLKGEGTDGTWDATRQRLIDRTTGEAASAVFISSPRVLTDGEVAFGVTTESRDGHSHNGVYRFHRDGEGWTLSAAEPGR
jgi:hypothetical protein